MGIHKFATKDADLIAVNYSIRIVIVMIVGILTFGLVSYNQGLTAAVNDSDNRTALSTNTATRYDQAAPVLLHPVRRTAMRDLAVNVKSALLNDSSLWRFPIDVGASNGVVTLFGTVDSSQRLARAVQVTFNVPGVHAVRSNLEIIATS